MDMEEPNNLKWYERLIRTSVWSFMTLGVVVGGLIVGVLGVALSPILLPVFLCIK